MNFSTDYIDDFTARLAYHSNALEGRHISLPETVSILFYQTVPASITLDNLYAIDNHQHALRFLISEKSFSIHLVNEIHKILTYRLSVNRDLWNQQLVLMEALIQKTNKQLVSARSEEAVIAIACAFHMEFIQIHNGQHGSCGRFLMNTLLIQHKVAPVVIQKEDEVDYIRLIEHKDLQGLFMYAHKHSQAEKDRMRHFMNNGGDQNAY